MTLLTATDEQGDELRATVKHEDGKVVLMVDSVDTSEFMVLTIREAALLRSAFNQWAEEGAAA